MSLQRRLAESLVRDHPDRAAGVLERLDAGSAARALAPLAPAETGEVVRRLPPLFAAALLEKLRPERAAAVVEELALDVAVRLVRRLAEEPARALLDALSSRTARAIRALLHFPENTAGAIMDPEVLALPEDMSAREALTQVRAAPEQARYNLYVVDREQRLVGALNLRELLLARPRARLCEIMVHEPQRLRADQDRTTVAVHPGWHEVHSLPVVDARGAYLGAVRYRTLRALEDELRRPRTEEVETAGALAELFAAGASGLLEALAGSGRSPGGRPRGA